ncbi:MAG: hypothetical protein GJU72_01590 [Acidithiobacillus ferriphilus]|nr:hypothetical protein [Acidithiobacillus ferriphilus]MBW9253969.1 hypothetical protein [Acidithiobacillus ferriphilus]
MLLLIAAGRMTATGRKRRQAMIP